MLKSIPHVRLPIVLIGIMYFFINMSSISFSYLFTPYMKNVLGLNIAAIGWLAGIMDGLGWILRIFSGILSDYLLKRKAILLVAYCCIAGTRFLAPMGLSVTSFILARFIDRCSNATQAPPRDALISEIACHKNKGAAYGLRQSLAFAGSTTGVILSGLFLKELISQGLQGYKIAFFLTSLPIIFAILILVFGIKEKKPETSKLHGPPRFQISNIAFLPYKYWVLVVISSIYYLSNCSLDVINAYVCSKGMNHSTTMMLQNIATVVTAYPFARLSDKIGRHIPLAIIFSIAIITNFIFFISVSGPNILVYLGAMFLGVPFGASQGIVLSKIAEVTNKELRSTAFGIYYFCSGMSIIMASSIFGNIAYKFGFNYSFMLNCFITSLALFMLIKLLGLNRKHD